MKRPTLEEKLELIAEMLETARLIVAELECGETVETLVDAYAAINNAKDLAHQLLAAPL